VVKRDISMTLPVTPWEAALGATVKVPTLDGAVDLKVPPGSQTGNKLRLRGKGLCAAQQSGDQYVVLAVFTPKAVTEQQKRLYEEMAKAMPFNPRKKLGV
jgi:curved DNA-binding protein